MGVDEGNLQIMDVEMMIENCPITIPTVYILTSSSHGVEMKETYVISLAKSGSTIL